MISDEISNLLTRSVKSVGGLELLLFLRQHAAHTWSAGELSAELRSSFSVVHGTLPMLVQDGLVIEEDSNRFRYCAVGDHYALVGQLDRLYKERPVAITRAIVS